MINTNMEITQDSETTDDSISLWHKCSRCPEVSFRGELERNSFICPKCKSLFPLSIEQRIKLLKKNNSPENEDVLLNETIHSKTDVYAAVETIDEYPVSLFVLETHSVSQQKVMKMFSEAIDTALKKSIPLLSVFTSTPTETNSSFNEIVPVLVQLEELAQQTIPYLTVLTETDKEKLTSLLPVGEIVIAECTSQNDSTQRHHAQPALHAPEEHLLPENNHDANRSTIDISIDCYIPRIELHTVITRFLKFFSAAPTNDNGS